MEVIPKPECVGAFWGKKSLTKSPPVGARDYLVVWSVMEICPEGMDSLFLVVSRC